jgi:hypothetical protein
MDRAPLNLERQKIKNKKRKVSLGLLASSFYRKTPHPPD